MGLSGDDCLAFELNRAEGMGPSARLGWPHLPTAEHASRAYIGSFALLSMVFAMYVAVVVASALGLRPLASRFSAASILGLGFGLGGWIAWRLGCSDQSEDVRLAESEHEREHEHGESRVRARARARVRLGEGGIFGSDTGNGAGVGRGLRLVALGGAWAGLAATGLGFLLAVLLPVGAYDALGYRLPAVAQWLDAGAVVWVAGDDLLRNGYPLALEVIAALTFRALGSAALVDAVAHLFVLAGALALAGYARQLGVSRAVSGLTAGLFLLVPMHLLNAPSGYADAAFAGCLVLFFVALARWVEAAHPSRALLAELGMAAALSIALKPHGFAFVGVSLVCASCFCWWLKGARRTALELGAVTALALPGLYFALRNLRHTGNPIYPLELRVAGHVLLRGKSSLDTLLTPDSNVPAQLLALPSWLRPFWVWLQPYGPARTYDDRLAGFGYAFVLVGVPALCWLALHAIRVRREQPGLGLVLGLTSLCWLLQPFSFWPRFSSWLWGSAALAIALSITALSETGRYPRALALASCTLLIALPEALYALHHVKRLDELGLTLLAQDSLTQLVRISTIDGSFVQRELAGHSDVCRTPWQLGTDDANLDGVVAQLQPRPRLHVIAKAPFQAQLAAARARGCRQLIVIGDNPMLAHVPPSLKQRVAQATAFGSVHLIPVLSAEVIP